MDAKKLSEQSRIFLNNLFDEIESKKINLATWEIDHLCYRTSSQENYKDVKSSFMLFSTLLSEALVNGRTISTFKLQEPILYKHYVIDLIEVPAPKEGKDTREGFEHLEVVIDQPFEYILEAYPHCHFKKSGLSKSLNPELQITLNSGAIKFHHSSLEQIINIEDSGPITSFLESSDILTKLSSYRPLISGTIPLRISTKESDLDILFEAENLNSFKKEALQLFTLNKTLFIKEGTHQKLDSLIINFTCEGLKVELFCQNKTVYQQQSNLHFLIEGRLLKLFPKTRSQLIALKEKGIKTEPAFGEVFNLTTPYADLLSLQKKSDQELKALYPHLS